MKPWRHLAAALLFLSSLSFAQNPPITTTQLNLPLSTQLTPVPPATVTVIGNPGPQTYWYWFVANYGIGGTSPTLAGVVSNAPNNLSGSNYVQVTPTYPSGASLDLLRTPSAIPPTGTCNCAVATAVTSGPINDQSLSLNSYTVTPFIPANFTLSLANEVVGVGQSDLILRQGPNGTFIVDLSLGGGGSGNVTGPGVSIVGDFALWNNTTGTALYDPGFGFPLPNSALQNPSTTVNGVSCILGLTCSVTAAPSGSASGDLSGTYPGPTVAGVNGVPLCNGFTPINGQALEYTTASSPVPCWTAGTAGSLTNPMTTLGDWIYGGASGTPTRGAGATSPNGVPQILASIPSGGVATALALQKPGIAGRIVSSSTGTGIVSTDCNPTRIEYEGFTGAGTDTLPTATTLGVPNCTFKVTVPLVLSSGATNLVSQVTITPTTWTINGSSSFVLLNGWSAVFFVDPNLSTNWVADLTAANASSFTPTISSPASTQTLTYNGATWVNGYGGINVDPQTGNYTLSCPTDRLGEIEFNISAAATLTLPQAGSTPCLQSSYALVVRNTISSTALLTIAATTSTFQPESVSSHTSAPGGGWFIYSDATSGTGNYHALEIPPLFGGVNLQTASYAATVGDRNKLVVMNCSAACALTLPATPPNGSWNIRALSIGSTLATVSLSSLTFNGGSTPPTLGTNRSIEIWTNASNYYGDLSAGAGTTLEVNGGGPMATANLNGSTPVAGTNGINATFQVSGQNVSAEIVGDGTATHFLSGAGTWITPTGTGSGISGSWTTTGNVVATAGTNAAEDTVVSYLNIAAPDTTVGDRGIWSNGWSQAVTFANGSGATPSNNSMYVLQLPILATQVIGHATFYVITQGTSETFYQCLYNAAGTTLLWSANGSASAATGAVSASAAQYTATPGTYWFAYGQTGTTAGVFNNFTTAGTDNLATINKQATRMGTSSNSISSGCPSSIGTLTSTNVNVAIFLEP